LSVTGTLPANITSNPVRDYYLPLVSLYANWCTKIAAYVRDNRGTFLYHIAWFTSTARPATEVLLGSTIDPMSRLGLASRRPERIPLNLLDTRNLPLSTINKTLAVAPRRAFSCTRNSEFTPVPSLIPAPCIKSSC
jgi:hypothetical protein